jgi:DNA-binding LytR/AlgR family response regulator
LSVILPQTKNLITVDDDPLVVNDLKQTLARLGCDVLGAYTEGNLALQELPYLKPEILLVDFSLNGPLNGIEAACRMREVCDVPVVYLTDEIDTQLLEEAHLAEPYGFIKKPLDEAHLKIIIGMALNQHSRAQTLQRECALYLSLLGKRDDKNCIFVRSDYKLKRIELQDICFVEALKDYILINTFDRVYSTHTSMKEILRILPESDFVRIHRSYIVQVNKIANIKYPELVIEGKMTVLPMGGLYKKEVYRRLQIV